MVGEFSNIENLSRLERALKGNAKSTVEALLYNAQNVGEIMKQLELHHGNPDIIINDLMNDLKRERPPKDGPPKAIIPFSQKLNNLVINLKALNKGNYLINPLEVRQLVAKLPNSLQIKWAENSLNRSTEASLDDLNTWLEHHVRVVSRLPDFSTQSYRVKEHSNIHTEEKQTNRKYCGCCRKPGHITENCRKFTEFNCNRRWKTVKSNNLCISCLNLRNHNIKDCSNGSVCNINNCTYKHHKLLHKDFNTNETLDVDYNRRQINDHHNSNQEETVGHNFEGSVSSTLFRILPVTLYGNGAKVETFAFLDEGSSVSLLDNDVAKKLNLKGPVSPLCLKWTKGVRKTENQSLKTSLKIAGASNNRIYNMKNVRTVENIELPEQSVFYRNLIEKYSHLKGLQIQDLHKAKPQILIGQEHAALLVSEDFREGGFNEPVASLTKLGWVVHGKTRSKEDRDENVMTVCEC
jgi:hypothetical protein